MNRIQSGRTSKLDGHKYEHAVCNYLNNTTGRVFVVEGKSNTKIDVRDTTNDYRFSIKNPSGKNTQVALITQDRFIDAFKLNGDLKLFVHQFFGGDDYESYPRHRKVKDEIDNTLNESFTRFLNDKKMELFNLLCVSGFKQIGDVNYIICADTKNSLNNMIYVDLNELKKHIRNSFWRQNQTTFECILYDKKIFHLQMKGSGKKYTSQYHSLMFHIYIKNLPENKKKILITERLS